MFNHILDRIKSVSAQLNTDQEPTLSVDVRGFDASFSLKNGVLIKSITYLFPDDKSPACEDTYYEIKIKPDNDHLDYLDYAQPQTIYFTKRLAGDHSVGKAGSIYFIGCKHRYIKFDLVSEFTNQTTPSHQTQSTKGLWLVATYQDRLGSTFKIAHDCLHNEQNRTQLYAYKNRKDELNIEP